MNVFVPIPILNKCHDGLTVQSAHISSNLCVRPVEYIVEENLKYLHRLKLLDSDLYTRARLFESRLS